MKLQPNIFHFEDRTNTTQRWICVVPTNTVLSNSFSFLLRWPLQFIWIYEPTNEKSQDSVCAINPLRIFGTCVGHIIINSSFFLNSLHNLIFNSEATVEDQYVCSFSNFHIMFLFWEFVTWSYLPLNYTGNISLNHI